MRDVLGTVSNQSFRSEAKDDELEDLDYSHESRQPPMAFQKNVSKV